MSGFGKEIVDFWFTLPPKAWFLKDEKFDLQIKSIFGDRFLEASQGAYTNLVKTGEDYLALIILLDQFSRNIYRDSPKAFEQDSSARLICKEGLRQNLHLHLPLIQRVFFYLPLEHSELLEDQILSVKLFTELCEQASEEDKEQFAQFLNFAIKHKNVIEKLGRFPHRNLILGRTNSNEEKNFLAQFGSGF
jgi:uncharacterized protein (DUF924 family)